MPSLSASTCSTLPLTGDLTVTQSQSAPRSALLPGAIKRAFACSSSDSLTRSPATASSTAASAVRARRRADSRSFCEIVRLASEALVALQFGDREIAFRLRTPQFGGRMHARGFTGADAGAHFCFAAAVEERRIRWLDARDDGLARDDAVTGLQFDASHVSGQGR